MPPLTIVLVPGFWEGEAAWANVTPLLHKKGYETVIAPLLSTGKSTAPGSPSMYNDSDHIREVITSLLDAGTDVMLVAHSAGGQVGTHGLKGLNQAARKAAGKETCVLKLAFVAGGLFPVGAELGPVPFFDYQGEKMFCKSPREILFNDVLDEDVANMHVKSLQCQPGRSWDRKVEFAGWMDIPSAYLVCERDACIPAQIQRQCAMMAKSEPIVSCDVGHCAPITQPEVVADFISNVAQSIIS